MIGGDVKHDKAKCLDFNENIKPGWITKKKNILCSEAKYENIVLMHDYLIFHASWYDGFLKFGEKWDVAMNVILNLDGSRFRDWCLNPYDVIPPRGPVQNREFFLPYDEDCLSEKMYISGSYWVAKKDFMLKYPLNEDLVWGQSEDLEWSNIVNKKTKFKMNIHSTVQCLKYKHCDFEIISQSNLSSVKLPARKWWGT
jgi:hypothetical protein